MSFDKVCNVEELEDNQGKCFEVKGQKIAIFKNDDGVYAINNACPHHGVGLCDGEVEDNVVTCPAHAWKFDITNGKGLTVPSDVKVYPVKVESGEVFVNL